MSWFTKNKSNEEIYQQIENLWECHCHLALLVKNMSDLMRQMAEGMQANKEEFEYLAQQTLRIAETQNKILSHLSDKRMEDYLTRDFVGTIH